MFLEINTNFVRPSMKAQTLHIKNPSKELLNFFRKLRTEKEEHKAKLIAKKDTYFPKSK